MVVSLNFKKVIKIMIYQIYQQEEIAKIKPNQANYLLKENLPFIILAE
jgi:hypothetical protein